MLGVVILAAGEGTRMKSNISKVCHKVGNKTMIERVVEVANSLKPSVVVVVVSKDNISTITNSLNNLKNNKNVRFKIQYEQKGTGHAVKEALKCIENNHLLVLLGDVPLITTHTLKKIVYTNYDAVVIGFKNTNPKNRVGRVVISKNKVHKIVEYLDSTDEERNIPLCNRGILWIKNTYTHLIDLIENNNAKKEYYLTDIIGILREKELKIGFLEANYDEFMGVNTQEDLVLANEMFKTDKFK